MTNQSVETTIKVLFGTLPAGEREALLKGLVQEIATPTPDRIVRRHEAAELLARSPRAIDYLAAAGHLPRVELPGRSRALGFRLSDVQRLIGG